MQMSHAFSIAANLLSFVIDFGETMIRYFSLIGFNGSLPQGTITQPMNVGEATLNCFKY